MLFSAIKFVVICYNGIRIQSRDSLMEGNISAELWCIGRILIGRNEKWNSQQENSMGKGTEVRKYKVYPIDIKKHRSH